MHSSAFWTALLGPVTVEAGRRPGWGLVWVALGCCYNAHELGGLEQNDSLTLLQPEVSDHCVGRAVLPSKAPGQDLAFALLASGGLTCFCLVDQTFSLWLPLHLSAFSVCCPSLSQAQSWLVSGPP